MIWSQRRRKNSGSYAPRGAMYVVIELACKSKLHLVMGTKTLGWRLFAIVSRSWYLRKSSASPTPPFQDTAKFGRALRLFRWWFPSLQGGRLALRRRSSRSPAVHALQYIPEGEPSSLRLMIHVSANTTMEFYNLTQSHQGEPTSWLPFSALS